MQFLNLLPRIFLIIGVTIWLAACGGGGGGSDSTADTNCVIGSSKIGDCKI